MAPHISIPKFTVNLDDPPDRRWDAVVAHFKNELKRATTCLESEMLPSSRAAAAGYQLVVFLCGLLVSPWKILSVAGFFVAIKLHFLWLIPLLLCAFVAYTIPFRREIAGIARAADIPCGKILLVQYVYEFVSACTSVVVVDESSGTPVHLRVMDWEMPGMNLRDLVCEVTFVKGGKPIFIASTWAGLVGVFTGMTLCEDAGSSDHSHNDGSAFSISINFRSVEFDGRASLYTSLNAEQEEQEEEEEEEAMTSTTRSRRRCCSPCIERRHLHGVFIFLRTLICLSLQCLHGTAGTVVRRVLTAGGPAPDAANKLKRTWLTSPVYFIFSGTRVEDCHCIARSRYKVDAAYTLLKPAGSLESPCISQCNSDWWTYVEERGDSDPVAQLVMDTSADMRLRGEALLDFAATGDWECRWTFLFTDPICNESSVYACIMWPAQGKYETRVDLPDTDSEAEGELSEDSDSSNDSTGGDGNSD